MKVKGVFLLSEVVDSPAFSELSATAIRVYLIFLRKRQLRKRKSPKHGDQYEITNNGQIEFTYAEALNKHGIKASAFKEGRDRLIEVGFLDITESGAGLFKSKTLYSVSERWRDFGRANFVRVIRPKDLTKGYRQKRGDG